MHSNWDIVLAILTIISFIISCLSYSGIEFPFVVSLIINYMPWVFSALMLLIGIRIGKYIVHKQNKNNDSINEESEATQLFKTELATKRIAAIQEANSLLSEMLNMELVELLNPESDEVDLSGQFTIAMLYGIDNARDYANRLHDLLDKYDLYFSRDQRAALRNLSHFQLWLFSRYNGLAGEEDDPNYVFVLFTLPIAEDLKKYIEETLRILAENMNQAYFEAEPSCGDAWGNSFASFRLEIDKMQKKLDQFLESIEQCFNQ